MCTIMTISRDLYLAHRDALRAQIERDALGNGDGYALLALGTEEGDTTLLRSLSVTPILAVLDDLMTSGRADRAWLHCRAATTGFTGVNGCHGFASGDWTVFHNGILQRREAGIYDVDSELIAADITLSGVEAAVSNLKRHENFANCFLVDNTTGVYYVVRRRSGTLFTDSHGNYSTHAVGPISISVLPGTTVYHSAEIVQQRRVSPWDSYDWLYSATTPGALPDNARRDIVAEAIELLPYVTTYEDMWDMIEAEGWDISGLPEDVWDAMTGEQQTWVEWLGVRTQPSAA